MVSFICSHCNATVKKPKVASHRCPNALFSCLDCHQEFNHNSVKSHTSCVTEQEKYQGALYKGKKRNSGASEANSTPLPVTHSEVPEIKKPRVSESESTVDVPNYRSFDLHGHIRTILQENGKPMKAKKLAKSLIPLLNNVVSDQATFSSSGDVISLK
ncbi:hypothetical protein RCL1_007071 [Eukaryota sp. TZLM3-RCL]